LWSPEFFVRESRESEANPTAWRTGCVERFTTPVSFFVASRFQLGVMRLFTRKIGLASFAEFACQQLSNPALASDWVPRISE
jgi:hypothetical protein